MRPWKPAVSFGVALYGVGLAGEVAGMGVGAEVVSSMYDSGM